MELKKTSHEGVIVFALSGKLDGTTANQAAEEINSVLAEKSAVVLEMSACTYVSSAGLRMLLMIAKQIAAWKGKLILCNVLNEVQDVMDMTGFVNFFIITDSLESAIAAVKAQ